MPRAYFLVKSEPSVYAFEKLVADGRTTWDGIRNFAARNHLRAMKKGDLLLFYHSNDDKAVVGVARVVREAYADPSAPGEDWSVVDVEPVAALREKVTLAQIKADPKMASMPLVKQSRLSAMPVAATEFARVLEVGKTKLR